ncbi:MAG: hypothetical protein R3F47_15010 [Gammaproteobacteria bacterium]
MQTGAIAQVEWPVLGKSLLLGLVVGAGNAVHDNPLQQGMAHIQHPFLFLSAVSDGEGDPVSAGCRGVIRGYGRLIDIWHRGNGVAARRDTQRRQALGQEIFLCRRQFDQRRGLSRLNHCAQ